MVPVIKTLSGNNSITHDDSLSCGGMCKKREMRIWPTPTSVILMMRRRSFPVTAGHVTIKNI